MTIQLLTDYRFGRYTIPAGKVVSVFDSATETGLIAAKQAVASAAAVTWTAPDETPRYDQLTPTQVAATQALVSEAWMSGAILALIGYAPTRVYLDSQPLWLDDGPILS